MRDFWLPQDAFARAGGAGGGQKPAAPPPPPAPPPSTIPDLPPPTSPFETSHVGTPASMPAGHPVSTGTGILIVVAMIVFTGATFAGAIFVAMRVLKQAGKVIEQEEKKKGSGKEP